MSEADTNEASEDVRPSKPMTRYEEKGAADLEKVTDFHEEQEIAGIGDAMKAVSACQEEEASAKALKQKQLSKIKVNQEDVELIMREFEVSKIAAEHKLKEFAGDVRKAMIELTN